MTRFIFAILGLLALAAPAQAATVAAASCEATAVNAATAQTSAGDTVTIPAGHCTWGAWAVWSPDNWNLTFLGAGKTQTVIDGNGQSILFAKGNKRISGIGFHCLTVAVEGEGWRLDHDDFSCEYFSAGVYPRGMSLTSVLNGLIDHSSFLNSRVIMYGYPGTSMSDLQGSTQMSRPLGLGTADAVYIEDNAFTFTVFGNAVDCSMGGSYVFRHNTVTDVYLEAHSIQGLHRACRKWEIYENTLSAQPSMGVYWLYFLRGGTGVVYNNTATGSFGAPYVAVDNVRSFMSVGAPFNACNGASPWDGNQDATGWPCLDQIGQAGDTAPFAGVPPTQTREPAYFWGNTYNGTAIGANVVNGAGATVKPNRDYFVNVGAKPGYTAYPYPHPLQGIVAPPFVSGPCAGVYIGQMPQGFVFPVGVCTVAVP